MFIDRYAVAICIALIIVALAFIIYGNYYREKIQDMLEQELIKFPECTINWWSVSHLILYSIFGFLIPNHPLTFFTIGVGFEIVEDYLSSDATTVLANCTKLDSKVHNLMCNGSINDSYWYCNVTDPWVNITGYIIGSAIRTTFFS